MPRPVLKLGPSPRTLLAPPSSHTPSHHLWLTPLAPHCSDGRWQARIRRGHNHDNPLTLGTFDTPVEAAVAYAHAANEGSASAKVKQATLTTAAAGSVLLSLATSLKRGHEQASKADPPAKRQRTDRTPPAPLLAGDQVRKQLMEAKELKDNELIDEVEYKQMKAAIIASV